MSVKSITVHTPGLTLALWYFNVVGMVLAACHKRVPPSVMFFCKVLPGA